MAATAAVDRGRTHHLAQSAAQVDAARGGEPEPTTRFCVFFGILILILYISFFFRLIFSSMYFFVLFFKQSAYGTFLDLNFFLVHLFKKIDITFSEHGWDVCRFPICIHLMLCSYVMKLVPGC